MKRFEEQFDYVPPLKPKEGVEGRQLELYQNFVNESVPYDIYLQLVELIPDDLEQMDELRPDTPLVESFGLYRWVSSWQIDGVYTVDDEFVQQLAEISKGRFVFNMKNEKQITKMWIYVAHADGELAKS